MGYDIFEKLCKQRGVSPYQVSKQTGVSSATLSSWKVGRYTPKQDKLQAIADYFNVTLDYLLNGDGDLSEDAPSYYMDEDARDIAQFLFENPDYKVLFDASRKVKREDIAFIRKSR